MEFASCYISLSNAAPVLKQSFITSKPNKMNSEQIIKSDVLDILFENRNKMYGAYNLRKFYNNRLYKALGGMLAMVAVFVAFAFMSPKKTKIVADVFNDSLTTVMSTIAKTPPPIDLPKPISAPLVPQAKFLSTIVVVPDVLIPDKIPTINDSVAIGPITVDPGPGNPGPLLVGTVPGTGDPGPDVDPQFPGGMKALHTYLQNHLTNPKDMEEGEKVRVVVKFVVGYDGKLKGFEILQDGGEEFNKEVIRVLKRMPAWIPGKTKGQNVSVNHNQSVVFTPAE
jgi:protein TonB